MIIATPRDRQSYDQNHYAPARRAGDYLYISGVPMGLGAGEGHEIADFERSCGEDLTGLA